ncbi:MAG: hypothetical protein JO066_14650, partial [Verrucomicrobia bacterium]|nr:hypothetical protein [Verrucomicrobiota bacterium]
VSVANVSWGGEQYIPIVLALVVVLGLFQGWWVAGKSEPSQEKTKNPISLALDFRHPEDEDDDEE